MSEDGQHTVDRLEATLLSPLPERLAIGAGTALYLSGLCDPACDPRSLRVGLGALEAAAELEREPAPGGEGGRQWAAMLEIPAATPEGVADVVLSATLDGRPARARVGEVALSDADLSFAPPPPSVVSADGSPLISICMATHEPDPARLADQLDSIIAQDWPAWVCVISDDASSPASFAELQRLTAEDERFVVSRSDRRLGFYRNFERALRMAPVEAGFIALCDQDDVWHADKLSALQATLTARPGLQLAYSDMRILDERGELISDTYWILRGNRWDDITSLLVANTVTGAASLLRAEVLTDALPFPPPVGEPYHDHWLALCALARGELAYLDRPTYDRVRHLDSVTAGTAHARALRRMRDGEEEAAGEPADEAEPRRRLASEVYRESYLQLAQFARIAELRVGDRIAPAKRRALRRFAAAERSASGPFWLGLRSLRRFTGRNETLGRERALAVALLGRRFAALRRRSGSSSA